jgi:hypothetical protein
MQQELPFNESERYTQKKQMSASCGAPSRRDRIGRRNRIMVARYYYWTEIRRRRFDDVIRILSNDEFFVEYRTISNAILEHSDYLNSLYREKPSSRFFRSEYPSWVWE